MSCPHEGCLLSPLVDGPWCEYGGDAPAGGRCVNLGTRIWGQKLGSEGSKLAESERGVWFSWKRYCICTPHFNKKYKPNRYRGRETILPPNSGAQEETALRSRLWQRRVAMLHVLRAPTHRGGSDRDRGWPRAVLWELLRAVLDGHFRNQRSRLPTARRNCVQVSSAPALNAIGKCLVTLSRR